MNEKMTKFMVVAVVAGLSYFLGASATRSVESVAPPGNSCEQQYAELKEQFSQLTQVDFAEYQQLKSQQERYKKADEILAKIMVIFLAELGIKSPQAVVQAEPILGEPQVSSGDPKSASRNTGASTPTLATQLVSNEATGAASVDKEPTWKSQEKAIHQIHDERDIEEFLEKVEIEDFGKEVISAKSLSARQLQSLNGRYAGQLIVPGRSPIEVQISLNGQMVDGEPEGQVDVKLIMDGQLVSHGSGTGSLRHVQSLGEDSQGVIVKTQGGSGYFQIYEAGNLRQLIGNYYSEEKSGGFQKKGTVRLKRQ